MERRGHNFRSTIPKFAWRKEGNCKELGLGTPTEIHTYQIQVHIFNAAPACEIGDHVGARY